MVPRNAEQSKQIRAKRVEQIQFAALKIFAERGFTGAKTSMIAAEAGLSEGLIYKYFQSKEELFISLVQWAVDGAKEALKMASENPGTPKDQLLKLTEEILEPVNRYPFLLIYQIPTADGIPDQAKRILSEQGSIDQYVDQLEQLIVEGQRLGQFSPEDDPRELTLAYLQVLNGLMIIRPVDGSEYFHPPRAEWILRLLTQS